MPKKTEQKQYPIQYLVLQGEDEWLKWMVGSKDGDVDHDVAVFMHKSVHAEMIKFVYKDFTMFMIEKDMSSQGDEPLEMYAKDRSGRVVDMISDKFGHLLPEELGNVLESDTRTKVTLWANIFSDVLSNLRTVLIKRAEMENLLGMCEDDEDIQPSDNVDTPHSSKSLVN